MTINNLTDMLVSGLYCLVNDSDRKVYVSHGTCILNAVYRLLDSLKHGSHSNSDLQNDFNQNKLRLEILETNVPHYLNRYMLAEYYKHNFLKKEYALYKQRSCIKFNISYKIETRGELKYKAVTWLKSHHICLPVGIFSTQTECELFIREYYNHYPYTKIIIADNSLTKEYLGKYYRDVCSDVQIGVGGISNQSDVKN